MVLKILLRGVSSVLFLIALAAFFVGGRFISEFLNVERVLAEVEGIVLAVGCGGLGYLARVAETRVEQEEHAESVPGDSPR